MDRASQAIKDGHMAKLVQLLNDGHATLEAKGNDDPPLWYAADRGRAEMVELLIMRGADVDGQGSGNWFHRTPLQTAILWGREEAAKLLMRHRADVNVRDAQGNSPLSLAARNVQHRLVALLLLHPEIKVNMVAKDGQTALWHAENKSDTQAAVMLEAAVKGDLQPARLLLTVTHPDSLRKSVHAQV